MDLQTKVQRTKHGKRCGIGVITQMLRSINGMVLKVFEFAKSGATTLHSYVIWGIDHLEKHWIELIPTKDTQKIIADGPLQSSKPQQIEGASEQGTSHGTVEN